MDIHIYLYTYMYICMYIHGFLICGQATEFVFWWLGLTRASIYAELGRKTEHLSATGDLNRSSKGQRAHMCIYLYIYTL